MLHVNERRLNQILSALPERKVAILGDFCVDRYFEIDPEITDVSNESGLPIHQVTAVRPEPGGGANVVKNMAALGVGGVYPVGLVGVDGEGFELGRILDGLGVHRDYLRESETRHTPVFTKPIIIRPGRLPEELNRFDVFPRQPLTEAEEGALLADLRAAFELADTTIVADYGETGKQGVVTPAVRAALADLARAHPGKPAVVDSRLFIDHFRHALVKPNADEAMTFLGHEPGGEATLVRLNQIGQAVAERNKRPVLITLGPGGALLCAPGRAQKFPVYPAEDEGDVDTVGSGDATIAAFTSALAAGAALDEAVIIAMAAASVTIQEIGTCGTATPDQIRDRFKQYAERFPEVVAG